MILVIEHPEALLPNAPEPRRCSTEQALRNMGWPFPATPPRPARPAPPPVRLQARTAPAAPLPLPTPARSPRVHTLPQLAMA